MAPAINLIDPEYFAEHGHPWDQYEWLRANAPVFWHDEPHGPGFWAITKYHDIRAISQNPKVFGASETGPSCLTEIRCRSLSTTADSEPPSRGVSIQPMPTLFIQQYSIQV